jgi:hypothetical protein
MVKCNECPVKYCSAACREKLEDAHKEFDCDNFAETFGKESQCTRYK